MLVLTRRTGESVLINKNIDVTILGFNFFNGSASSLRIGINAPSYVHIIRKEVTERENYNPDSIIKHGLICNEDDYDQAISRASILRDELESLESNINSYHLMKNKIILG